MSDDSEFEQFENYLGRMSQQEAKRWISEWSKPTENKSDEASLDILSPEFLRQT
jgi:hypothetical protein